MGHSNADPVDFGARHRLRHGEAARKLAHTINEELAGIIARHPGRFCGFGILPLPDVDGSLREIEHALDELQLEGIVLYTNFGGIYPGDSRLDPVFEEFNRRKTVTYVHPVAPPEFDVSQFGYPAANSNIHSTPPA